MTFLGNIARIGLVQRPLQMIQAKVAAGSRIMWLIAASKVLFHQRVRHSKGKRENPISGEAVELLSAGDMTQFALKISDEVNPLAMSVPAHVAERNRIAISDIIQVSLLVKSVHNLPDFDSREVSQRSW